MRIDVFVVLVLSAVPALARCPGSNSPVAATSTGSPPTARVFLDQAATESPPATLSPAAAESTLPTTSPTSAENAPPVPPPVTYEVWGYHWNGNGWDQPKGYHYKTADFQKAADYLYEVATFGGWIARINCDTAPFRDFEMSDPLVPMKSPKPPRSDKISFTVWAYKLIDGKWQKQDAYCGTSNVLEDCQKYMTDVNAVPGWYAVSNCPPAKVTSSDGLQINGPKTRGIPNSYVYKGNGRWDHYHQSHYYSSGSSSAGSSSDDSWVQAQWEADRRQDELNTQQNEIMQQFNQNMIDQANRINEALQQNNNSP